MLSRAHVLAALEAKRHAFDQYEQHTGQELARYAQALDWLARQSPPDLEQVLAPVPRPGALPTPERVVGRSVVIPFAHRWSNHEEARAWAMGVLRDVPTLAVDGSQIAPNPEFSIPIGAVQVGWFENPHDAERRHVKDIHFEILSPEELAGERGDAGGGFPDLEINARRFELECEVLSSAMRRMAGRQPPPVCFFDGSLVISFAAQMRPERQRRYLLAVRSLLEASETTGVPLIGYVDTSYARDLVAMLRAARREPSAPGIHDALLLRSRMAWGDRSEALVCARDDQLFGQGNESLDYYGRVHFTYLKTSSGNAPARLDFPAWILEAGLLEWVLDVVRAEGVVGTGYPYGVETADALAVITMQDRERFYNLCQDFLSEVGLELRYSRKAYSKRGRR